MDLHEYLTKNSIPHKEFAEKLGVDVESVSSYVLKRRTPSLKVALRIENLTHHQVSVSELVRKESSKK